VVVSGDKLHFEYVGLHYIAFSIAQVENKSVPGEKQGQNA